MTLSDKDREHLEQALKNLPTFSPPEGFLQKLFERITKNGIIPESKPFVPEEIKGYSWDDMYIDEASHAFEFFIGKRFLPHEKPMFAEMHQADLSDYQKEAEITREQLYEALKSGKDVEFVIHGVKMSDLSDEERRLWIEYGVYPTKHFGDS